MKVSVIMPAYNREDFIEPAIRSLLRQKEDAELDIIVVDDGSTDRTPQIVDTLGKKDSCIRLIRQPKGGVAAARNAGLDNLPADTELVTFLDSDDLSLPGRFTAEIPYFVSDPELVLTYSRMVISEDIDDETLSPRAKSNPIHGISLTTALFRKGALDAVGRFDETFKQAEDLDFLTRLFEQPLKYLLVDNVSIVYRRHSTNTTNDKKENHWYAKRALLRSAQRRRRDPKLRNMPRFFNSAALRNA